MTSIVLKNEVGNDGEVHKGVDKGVKLLQGVNQRCESSSMFNWHWSGHNAWLLLEGIVWSRL